MELNWSRIFLGGLLAGLIVNAHSRFSGAASSWVDSGRLLCVLSTVPFLKRQSGCSCWILSRLGIAAVWLYAAVRTRFGPGPRTAVIAGFAYWIIGYALPDIGTAQTRVFPAKLFVITNLGGIGVIILAALVGASFYRVIMPSI